MRSRIDSRPVRVQLMFTPPSTTSDPPTSTAATIRNAAELMSAGTRIASRLNASTGSTDTARPSRRTVAPAAASIRSVWSRLRCGSTTVVVPSASSPASSTHDFTWALAIGITYVVAVSAVP
jgi:hypothetical protein